MRVGDQISYGASTIRIADLTEDGRPGEVWFEFDVALEDPSLHWLQWKDGVYISFAPPETGETVVLPSVVVPW